MDPTLPLVELIVQPRKKKKKFVDHSHSIMCICYKVHIVHFFKFNVCGSGCGKRRRYSISEKLIGLQ